MRMRHDWRSNERSVEEPDSRSCKATDGIEAVEVDFFTRAAVEISDLQSEGRRAQDHILESTEPKVVDLAVHRHDVLVAVLIDCLAGHVARVVLWVRLHPGCSESLMHALVHPSKVGTRNSLP
jgi:hypothetical protein